MEEIVRQDAPSAAENAPAIESVVQEPAAKPAPSEDKSLLAPVPEGARRYETLMILPSRYEGGALEEILGVIKKLIESVGAQVVRTDSMGRRNLAYPIQKQTDGVYVNVIYDANTSLIKPIERELKLQGTVIRFLTTVRGA